MAWNEISWKYGIADCHLWLLEVIPSPSLHIILYHSKPVEKWKADTTTINKSLIIRVWSKRPVSETDTQICSAFFNDHFVGLMFFISVCTEGSIKSSKNMFTFHDIIIIIIIIYHYHSLSSSIMYAKGPAQHASHICHCHTPPTCHPILRKRYERLDMLLGYKKKGLQSGSLA